MTSLSFAPRLALRLALLPLAVLPGSLQAQAAPVRYDIAFPDAAHHQADVTVHFSELNPGALQLRMSRTSPGRYALHEFAKNVYDFHAVGADGRAVEVERPNPHEWDVKDHGGEVTVTYTVFGDRADGTYLGVDRTHAHLNIPATFMWARGLRDRPVQVTFHVPQGSGWKVATQLVPTDDPATFTAPDLDYFIDSPTELSDYDLRQWTVQGPDGPETMRLTVHHQGTSADMDRFTEGVKKIVDEERAVWGTFPAYDHGTYTFLACYLPWVDGDGMEHRNSTSLTEPVSLAEAMLGLWGTVAHEYFHSWNMERIRSAELEPFDLESADMSRELWFGEGFTSYYQDLVLARAGLIDVAGYARRLGGVVDRVVNAPGRHHFDPIEMSMQAPFVDAAVSIDPTNRVNTYLSYYTWGEALGAGLDLTLRERFPGVTLDDFMRAMWAEHGSPEIPYTVEDLQATLAEVTGDAAFAADFFDRFVRGGDVPDYATLLAGAGLVLRPANPVRPMLARTRLVASSQGLVVALPTVEGTPLHDVGVGREDVILTVDGAAVATPQALEGALQGKRPGDRVHLTWRSRGSTLEGDAVLVQDPTLEVVPVEATGARPSAAAQALRNAWLGDKR